MQRFEHEAVAAERNDNVRGFRVNRAVTLPQLAERLLGGVGVGCHKRGTEAAAGETSHPPVTLMWRETAGRL
ncbi:hypothetical protein D3C83_100810 [compost metagenome]